MVSYQYGFEARARQETYADIHNKQKIQTKKYCMGYSCCEPGENCGVGKYKKTYKTHLQTTQANTNTNKQDKQQKNNPYME